MQDAAGGFASGYDWGDGSSVSLDSGDDAGDTSDESTGSEFREGTDESYDSEDNGKSDSDDEGEAHDEGERADDADDNSTTSTGNGTGTGGYAGDSGGYGGGESAAEVDAEAAEEAAARAAARAAQIRANAIRLTTPIGRSTLTTRATTVAASPSARLNPGSSAAINSLLANGGSVSSTTRDPEDDCMSGNWIGNTIDYWATSASNGKRATGADACLTTLQKGKRPGANPPGYSWAQNYASQTLGVDASQNINACHLIPKQVGGNGSLANLATCGRPTNARQVGSTITPMTIAENSLVSALRIPGGQTVYYQVIPRYAGSRTVPYAFMIYAYGSKSGAFIDETIGNIVYDRNGTPHNIGTATGPNGSIPIGPAR